MPRLAGPLCSRRTSTKPGLGLSKEERSGVATRARKVLAGIAYLFPGGDRSGEPSRTNLRAPSMSPGSAWTSVFETSITFPRPLCAAPAKASCGKAKSISARTSETITSNRMRRRGLAAKGTGSDLTVYRPAVIVGDSRTGFTSSYHNIYRFFQYTHLFWQQAERDADGRWHHAIRLRLDGRERRKPRAGRLGLHGNRRTSSAARVPPGNVSPGAGFPDLLRDVEAAMANYFRYSGVTFVGPEGLPAEKVTPVEMVFYEYINSQDAYLHSEPVFDIANTRQALPHLPCPLVDQACLHRLIDFGVRDPWGKANRRGSSLEKARDPWGKCS